MIKKPRYIVWYERPRTGHFSVLELSTHRPAIGGDREAFDRLAGEPIISPDF
jgi:hypothetical protein